MKQYTMTSTKAHFGARLKNTRWECGGISDDNSVVAVFVWLGHAKLMKMGKLFFDDFDKKHQGFIGYLRDLTSDNDRNVNLNHFNFLCMVG